MLTSNAIRRLRLLCGISASQALCRSVPAASACSRASIASRGPSTPGCTGCGRRAGPVSPSTARTCMPHASTPAKHAGTRAQSVGPTPTTRTRTAAPTPSQTSRAGSGHRYVRLRGDSLPVPFGGTSSASWFRCGRGTRPRSPSEPSCSKRGTHRNGSPHAGIPSACRGPTARVGLDARTAAGADPVARCRVTWAPDGRTWCTERQHDEARLAPIRAFFVRETGGRCQCHGRAAGRGWGSPALGAGWLMCCGLCGCGAVVVPLALALALGWLSSMVTSWSSSLAMGLAAAPRLRQTRANREAVHGALPVQPSSVRACGAVAGLGFGVRSKLRSTPRELVEPRELKCDPATAQDPHANVGSLVAGQFVGGRHAFNITNRFFVPAMCLERDPRLFTHRFDARSTW